MARRKRRKFTPEFEAEAVRLTRMRLWETKSSASCSWRAFRVAMRLKMPNVPGLCSSAIAVSTTAPADRTCPYRAASTESDRCGSSSRWSIQSHPCLSIDLIGRYHEASRAIILV
jgi:hypothetical protein